MPLEKKSPCKVNLLLNILGKRPDGFHELETVMHPIALCDQLTLERRGSGVELICSDASLPTDSQNLVRRAAEAFLGAAQIRDGVKIHLDKKIPLAAGLGGGSGNAATTLLGLNQLFGAPLADAKLIELAAALGSDGPFFLQTNPGLRHFDGWGVSRPCALPVGSEWVAGPRRKIGRAVAAGRPVRGEPRILQLPRSARAGEISAAEALPGIPPFARGRRHAHARQRLRAVC